MPDKTPVPVLIEWIDAASDDGSWTPMTQAGGLVRCFSVGYVVKETKRQITLVQTICLDTMNMSGQVAIPKGCIVRRRRMKK